MHDGRRRTSIITVCVLAALAVSAAPAAANHAWGTYHWARTANPFVVPMDNNFTTAAWDAAGTAAASDWSASSVLDSPLSAPKTDNSRCKPSSGRVEVCNRKYGANGWLGLASIWLSGSHITKATVKLNDTYFNTSTYNTPIWRQSVTCQEIGHTFGLDHQSEDPAVDLDTCMDYSASPNLAPNAHDYAQLESIYLHTDSSSTLASPAVSSPRRGLRRVKDALWVEDLGNGQRRFVWVIWATGGPHLTPPQGA